MTTYFLNGRRRPDPSEDVDKVGTPITFFHIVKILSRNNNKEVSVPLLRGNNSIDLIRTLARCATP